MHKFKDFGIPPKENTFLGDKISIKKLIDQPIKVIDFKVGPSKQKEGTQVLTLAIEKSGDRRITFTGSTALMDQIAQVPKDQFPFETVIKDNDRFEFT